MNRNLKQILRHHSDALQASDKTLRDIYTIMFSTEQNVLWEKNNGFRIQTETYGQTKEKIQSAAASLYQKIGATHNYVALAIDNSPEWIIGFWAILMSGNKPYLVNLRYPAGLTQNIMDRLQIHYILCTAQTEFTNEHIVVDDLLQDASPTAPDNVFEDELAFSSSATSMNEVICFYTGSQIAEQILNFDGIIKAEPRMTKHYKGQLKQLAFLPFYHVFGLFAVYFWFTFFGRTLVFLRDLSADTILKTCRRHKVTHIFAVPLLWHTIEKSVTDAAKEQGEKQYQKLQKGISLCTKVQNVFPSAGAAFSKWFMRDVTDKLFGRSVMFCINGGSYLRDSALQLLNGIGYNTYNGYGMSEIGITSVELRHKPKHRNENTIGRPFTSVEYRLDNQGILEVRGSSLCIKKQINGQEQIIDGWFHTGDYVECHNGNYVICGRQGDTVIGENGENIHPDTVEKLFCLSQAKCLSVLGLNTPDGERLSVVVQISPYISQDTLDTLRQEIYKINETLPSAMAIQRFYFTTDPLISPNAIKVSRTQLKQQIANQTITLIPFADMILSAVDDQTSPLATDVRKIVASVLGKEAEQIGYRDHLFYDLGASSIQYFSILTKLSEHFHVVDYNKNEKYCYTVKEICEYLEKRV
ncbi:MAG: AMP-binding protein [Clostridia bacterium]|nr:AMP-binding protein [Clostridia bacterium]